MKYWLWGSHGFLGQHVDDTMRKHGHSFAYPPEKVDASIVCAAYQGGIAFQGKYPADIIHDNMRLLEDIFSLVKEGKLVQVLSGCMYPGNLTSLQEDEILEGRCHPSVENYGMCKRMALLQGWAYRKQYGLNVVSIVPINLYGPGDRFETSRSHAMAALIRKFYEAKRDNFPTVTLWGTGKAIREWMYVEDCAEYVVRAAEKYDKPEPVNIGIGKGLKMSELAEIISAVVGYKGRTEYDPSKGDGAPCKVADVTRMHKELGDIELTPLVTGIEKTLKWYQENIEYANSR